MAFFFETFLKKFEFTLFAFFVYFLIAHIFSYLDIYIICTFFLNQLCCSHVLSTTLNEYFESLAHALISMCQQCLVNQTKSLIGKFLVENVLHY